VRTIHARKIETPSARARLKPAAKPYRGAKLDKNVTLACKRDNAGSDFVGLYYIGDGKYIQRSLGRADDSMPANGETVLNYYQASRKALVLAAAILAPAPPKGPVTVNMVLDSYFDRRDREGKSTTDERGRADLRIRRAIGTILTSDLTRDIISDWHFKMAKRPKGGKIDQEAVRASKVTANRLLIVLRAALNQAFRDGKTPSDTAWRTVPPFKNVDTSRLRYLSHDEIVRSTNAAQGAFRNLWKAGLYTGCRRGELTCMRVADFNSDSGTIFVGKSKSGKSRHVVLTPEGQKFFSSLCAGRSGGAFMLVRDNGEPWGRFDHALPTKKALAAANITGACFYTLRHTAASQMVMAGAPLNVVAQNLGHADTRMVEKHYAHLSPSYVADTIRKFTPDYGLAEASILVPMRG